MAAVIKNSGSEVALAEECVYITASHGETYTTKLSSIKCIGLAVATATGIGSATHVTVSGRTITFVHPGMTDYPIYLNIKGNL